MKTKREKMIRNKNYSLRNIDILYDVILFLLIIPVMEPEGIAKVAPIFGDLVWGVYSKLFSAGIISMTFVFVTIKSRKKIDVVVLCILAFVVASGMISLFKLGSLKGWISRYLCIICATFLVVICQQNLLRLIRIITIYLEILIAVNFIFVLMYPDGMYASYTYKNYNWMLGYKSSLQYYVFPAITFSWLDAAYSQKKQKTIKFCTVFGLCIAEAALSNNIMLLSGLLLEAVCIVLHVERKTKLLNGYTYFAVSFIFNLIILFFVQIVWNIPIVFVALTSLGKTPALSGRVGSIWPRAIAAISESPWFGYGVLTAEENIRMLGKGKASCIHAHNHLLQILLDGGIFLFGFYLVFVVVIVYRMMHSKELKSTQIFGMSIFILLLMSSVEIFTRSSGTGMWMIFLLCAMTKELDYQFLRRRQMTKIKLKIGNVRLKG